jgi:hypothetical protein
LEIQGRGRPPQADAPYNKTEIGGVVLDVYSEEEAREAFIRIRERFARISKEAEDNYQVEMARLIPE